MSVSLVSPPIPPLQPPPKDKNLPWHSHSFQGDSLQKFPVGHLFGPSISHVTHLGLLAVFSNIGLRGVSVPLWLLISPSTSFLDSCHCSFHFTIGSVHCCQNYLLGKKRNQSSPVSLLENLFWCPFAYRINFSLLGMPPPKGPWQLA